ncbi:hypothetical protein AWB77_03112 [Caballeronia fortuita]|uniref:Pentapeptide MXKDX repeat protein n=1 Tax=Caballeronia fortuita TaxID=1777138 RepID=A0A158BQ18_9BURK|nr:hypothetical protein [Caballeronia fortuita]SAK72178.1 hypothetical protein AWB77_03112 [Caballeronia fortuita]
MSKNKLLIAITAGLFGITATTGAFAQTSSGNSSAAMGNDTAGAATDNSAATTPKKHKMHKHTTKSTATKKTPAAETGNDSATESGQSK